MKCADIRRNTGGEGGSRAVTDAEERKRGERTGLDTRVVGRCKRWVLGVGPVFHAVCAAANALSTPPGEYGRKAKTQRNYGAPHKQRSMWINSMQREEPYQGLTYTGNVQRDVRPARSVYRWWKLPSSARVVRCWVKSRNERNPRSMLPARNGGDS